MPLPSDQAAAVLNVGMLLLVLAIACFAIITWLSPDALQLFGGKMLARRQYILSGRIGRRDQIQRFNEQQGIAPRKWSPQPRKKSLSESCAHALMAIALRLDPDVPEPEQEQ